MLVVAQVTDMKCWRWMWMWRVFCWGGYSCMIVWWGFLCLLGVQGLILVHHQQLSIIQAFS